MTTVDVMPPVLVCRYFLDDGVCDIEVSLHERTTAGATFQAVAFFASDGAMSRQPVVNDRGMPLVAIGPSPSKAAWFMSSVLQRRYGRSHGRSLSASATPHRY